MSIPAVLLVHTATVRPYLGNSAYGDAYGDPFEVPCRYEGRRQLVRVSDGSEVVSEGTFWANPVDIPAGSRVTVAGRDTYVLASSPLSDGGLTGLDHVEVALA